jgi:hypothetical protein
MNIFNEAKTYDWDLPLFKKLGLKPFCIKDCSIASKKHYVGKVTLDYDRYIKIWVQPTPAQFWEFEVCNGTEIIKLSTGSGALSNYYQTIELFVDGMLVIKK